MTDEKEKSGPRPPHNVILEGRRLLTVSGVQDVDRYDEQSIEAYTELGKLTIKGANLHINKIDVQTGDLNVEGEIWELVYSEETVKKAGILARLFR